MPSRSPEEFGEFVKSEVRTWSKVVRDAGMQPQ
jgi:tripartite-type tricarboxylate transporter receptor subunit TctC